MLAPIGELFGNDKLSPVFAPGAKRLVKPLSMLTLKGVEGVDPALEEFQRRWDLGTGRQENLMGEQEQIGRQLLARRMGNDPNALLGSVSNTLFNLINPNVVDPLAAHDVAGDRLYRRAAGINPAAVASTADKLRRARIASGRYYDTARTLAPLIPGLYNQVYNAGVNDADIASGYIPSIMQGYRSLDDASLAPIRERLNLTRGAARTVGDTNRENQSGVVGYEQKRNWADRVADADAAAWSTIKDVANTAMSVYGSLYGGGAGGALGGMMGGGGGGGGQQSPAPAPAATNPRFMPAPMQPAPSAEPPAWAAPGYWNLRY